MFSIKSCAPPANALLNKYTNSPAYTDCFQTRVDKVVTQQQYVAAFYTTWLFKVERVILKWAVSKPSSDAQARQLADGSSDAFAAWQVEARAENQLLLSDFRGRTRSWLMVVPVDGEGATQLFFGSAVTPVESDETGNASAGYISPLLLGFHKCYSVLLLYSAKSKLDK